MPGHVLCYTAIAWHSCPAYQERVAVPTAPWREQSARSLLHPPSYRKAYWSQYVMCCCMVHYNGMIYSSYMLTLV